MRVIHLKLLAAALFWGCSAIAGKVAMSQLGTSLATFLRFLLAAAIALAVVTIKREALTITLAEHARLAVLGIVGVTLCYYFYFSGLASSSAFNAGLIESTIPLLTLMMATLSGSEPTGRRKAAGFAIAYMGVAVIVTRLDLRALRSAAISRGDLQLLISTIFFAVYNILVKSWPTKLSYLGQMFFVFLYGALGLLPWVTVEGLQRGLIQPGAQPSWQGAMATVFMALGGSVLAYVYFNEGINEIGASAASSVINIVPVITMACGMALLGERPKQFQWAGAAIIMIGLVLANMGPKQGVRPDQAEC